MYLGSPPIASEHSQISPANESIRIDATQGEEEEQQEEEDMKGYEYKRCTPSNELDF